MYTYTQVCTRLNQSWNTPIHKLEALPHTLSKHIRFMIENLMWIMSHIHGAPLGCWSRERVWLDDLDYNWDKDNICRKQIHTSLENVKSAIINIFNIVDGWFSEQNGGSKCARDKFTVSSFYINELSLVKSLQMLTNYFPWLWVLLIMEAGIEYSISLVSVMIHQPYLSICYNFFCNYR